MFQPGNLPVGPESVAKLPKKELVRLVRQFQWVHSIDLGEGIITPGKWGKGNPRIKAGLKEMPLKGKKVLDVGCWDGLYAFEAERRGASEVYAIDLIHHPTFELAQAALKSKTKYYARLSVYDIERLGIHDFDVVLFAGVYYHLKDPLRALACLRRVMKDGGLLLLEGAVLRRSGCFAKFYYQDSYDGDRTNWWIPTTECLRQWVRCSLFDIEREYRMWGRFRKWRHTLIASAVRRADPLYWDTPEELKEFCLCATSRV